MYEDPHPTRQRTKAPDHFSILKKGVEADPTLRRHSLTDAQDMVRKATHYVMNTDNDPTKLAEIERWSNQWERAFHEVQESRKKL